MLIPGIPLPEKFQKERGLKKPGKQDFSKLTGSGNSIHEFTSRQAHSNKKWAIESI